MLTLPAGPTALTHSRNPRPATLPQPCWRMSPKFPGKAVNWNYVSSCLDKAPPVLQNSDLSTLSCRKSPQTIPLIPLGVQESLIWPKNLQAGGRREAGNHCSHPRDLVPAQPSSQQSSPPARAAQDAQLSSKRATRNSLEKSVLFQLLLSCVGQQGRLQGTGRAWEQTPPSPREFIMKVALAWDLQSLNLISIFYLSP